jgi:hypothetical protein
MKKPLMGLILLVAVQPVPGAAFGSDLDTENPFMQAMSVMMDMMKMFGYFMQGMTSQSDSGSGISALFGGGATGAGGPLPGRWMPGRQPRLWVDGVWQGPAGDVLWISGDRFIWFDAGQSSLVGWIRLQGARMWVYSPVFVDAIPYRVRRARRRLALAGPDGKVLVYRRVY